MVKLRNGINELTNKLYNIQLRKNNSNFNDINMIQPVHSFNDNLLWSNTIILPIPIYLQNQNGKFDHQLTK